MLGATEATISLRRKLITRVAAIAALALVAAWAVVYVRCSSESWALSEAARLQPGAAEEVQLTAGDRYSTQVRIAGVERSRSTLSFLALPRWDAEYSVVIRSKECTAFEQRTSTWRNFGPLYQVWEMQIGGIHDWSLFRTLDEWDAVRRVALLSYVAEHGKPSVLLASTLGAGDFPGSWWSDPGPARNRALKIGRDAGFSDADLAWVEYDQSPASGELLGFEVDTGKWTSLTRPENVESSDGPTLEPRSP